MMTTTCWMGVAELDAGVAGEWQPELHPSNPDATAEATMDRMKDNVAFPPLCIIGGKGGVAVGEANYNTWKFCRRVPNWANWREGGAKLLTNLRF
jgi:hypothetical protein